MSSQEWFQFGANYSETYLGNDFVIRGIKAEAWTRNLSYSTQYSPTLTVNGTFSLTYFFSLPSWNWFRSNESRIPVRAEIKGETVTDNGTVTIYPFHHYYDYVQFFVDDLTLAEELVFDIADFYEQCNVTEYCNIYKNNSICSVTRGMCIWCDCSYYCRILQLYID